MSMPADQLPIPAPITDLVAEVIGSIAGVEVTKVGWLDERAVGTILPRRRQLDISAWAWGPTLHRRHRNWRQDVAKAVQRQRLIDAGASAEDADDQLVSTSTTSLYQIPAIDAATSMTDPVACAAALRPCLETVAAVQRRLSEHGAAHGFAEPPLRDHAGGPERDRQMAAALLHHAIPSTLAEVLVAVHGAEAAAGILVDGVTASLASSDPTFEDVLNDDSGTAGVSLGDLGPTIWTTTSLSPTGQPTSLRSGDRVILRPVPFTDGPVFDGTYLTAEGRLPDSACTALVGRRVAEFMATGHPALDDATITCVEPRDEHVALTVETRAVMLAEHPLLGPVLRELSR